MFSADRLLTRTTPLRPTQPARPLVVVWRVLDRCNLECPFCAYDSRLAFARHVVDPDKVSRFIGLLGQWRVAAGRPVLLSWLGGEPLLWNHLQDMTEAAFTAGIGVSMTTNGTTLGSSRVRQHLLDYYREVTISIDGFADLHDRMRGWPGAFGKLEKGIELLAGEKARQSSPMRLKVNVVLMRDNIERFSELCRELSRWGVEEITFNQLGGRDRPEFYPTHRLLPEEVTHLQQTLPQLRNELSSAGTTLLGGDAYLRRIIESTRDAKLCIADCKVADTFLFIDEGGQVAPCNYTADEFGFNVDQIVTVEDLDTIGTRLNERQRRTPSPACANCLSTQQFSKFDA